MIKIVFNIDTTSFQLSFGFTVLKYHDYRYMVFAEFMCFSIWVYFVKR
jgi:hypothetical protein